jgi:DNA-binding beta-propeller fold protein YncE
VDVAKKQIVTRNFITDGTDNDIEMPYGIKVNPITKDIYVTDAKNFVLPGRLYCFDKEGKFQWRVVTGDIPAHIVFLNKEDNYDRINRINKIKNPVNPVNPVKKNNN